MQGVRPIAVAVLGMLALLSAAGAAGWATHGEAIFLRLAEGAWTTCF